MEDLPVDKSAYSLHFNILKLLGAWAVGPGSPRMITMYAAYKTIMTAVALAACASLCIDFYLVFGDFKKMTWNMCVNALFSGSMLKNICTVHRSRVMNNLRRNLHKKAISRGTPEDENLNNSTEREWKYFRNLFYAISMISVPVWLLSWRLSYLWGPRGIPIPFRLPFDYDLEDELQYNLIFFFVAIAGLLGICLVMENELAMLTILIQISREYKRLLNDFTKMNELYDGEKETNKKEVNPWLRQLKAKALVKEYCTNQLQLIQFSKDFELCYRESLVLQVLVMVVLVVVNGILVIMEFGAITLNLGYQLCIMILVLLDMFLLCSWCTKIHDQCLKVGEEAYATLWYEMSGDIRRDICMIIMRSQKPPKITCGKLMEFNLSAFMTLLNTVYSWLTLFHHLAFKST